MKNIKFYLALAGLIGLTGCAVPTSRYEYIQDKEGNVTIIREGADYFGGTVIGTDGKPLHPDAIYVRPVDNRNGQYRGTAGQWLQCGRTF